MNQVPCSLTAACNYGNCPMLFSATAVGVAAINDGLSGTECLRGPYAFGRPLA
jgi:hypothetical protein